VTYEYECDGCKSRHEAEQRITEAPLTKCPSCGEDKLKRLISSGAFVLNGTGWYKTGGY